MSLVATHDEVSHDADAAVQQALERLIATYDPTTLSAEQFRGHQYDAGLAWVHHPVGLGGLSARPDLQTLVDEQLRAVGAKPPHPSSGFLMMAGPTLHQHGTEEQQRRFLRSMFTGEDRWCQLFSEPGAGSDLAGLATSATRDGAAWIVNGQKVWNTMAHIADWGMLVARTDPGAPKHRGLTYFVVDMHAAGVEVRPLRQLTGTADFNEVYLTDVRVPDANRVGDVGAGWLVALSTLGSERSSLGGDEGPVRSDPIDDLLATWASSTAQTTVARELVARLWIDAEVLRLTNARALACRKRGVPSVGGPLLKLASAKVNQAIYDACVTMLGPAGMVDFDYTFRRADAPSYSGSECGVRHAFLRSRANSIEGGTSEVMRNIIGEQVLGMPREPRADKDLPWRDVPRN